MTNDTLTMTDNVRDRSARVRLAEGAAPAPHSFTAAVVLPGQRRPSRSGDVQVPLADSGHQRFGDEPSGSSLP